MNQLFAVKDTVSCSAFNLSDRKWIQTGIRQKVSSKRRVAALRRDAASWRCDAAAWRSLTSRSVRTCVKLAWRQIVFRKLQFVWSRRKCSNIHGHHTTLPRMPLISPGHSPGLLCSLDALWLCLCYNMLKCFYIFVIMRMKQCKLYLYGNKQ